MSDASSTPTYDMHGLSSVGFNWEAFRAACRDRGADTVPDCSTLTGVPVRTLYEVRRKPASTTIRTAAQLRDATSLGLDVLFPVRVAA
ncbi:hypothetical protein AB0L22_08585 [Micromonospora haikouensis]|uniref:hypothetical protein n=1 Tax=Micromonospora haikouensis TaxID=686309 RepID=UPI0034317A9D